MEQRRLRLGDILDDYCPRERRVTNHAIVAMIEDDVKQTRCTTCDAEHVYKGGQSPRKRRKDSGSALYQEVLAGMPEASELSAPRPAPPIPVVAGASALETDGENGRGLAAGDEVHADVPAKPDADDNEPGPVDEREADGSGVDDGPIHRRLIRATLPRPEGQKEVRQVPDFTIRPNGNRPGGGFRGDRMRGHGGAGSGSGMRTGGRRFGGGNQPGGGGGARTGGGRNRPGLGGGNGTGRGPSGNPGRPQGGRKRSR